MFAGTLSRRYAARHATYRRLWLPCSSGSVTSTRRWTHSSTHTSTETSGKRSRTHCNVRSATFAGAHHPTWRHSMHEGRLSGTMTGLEACTPKRTWTTAIGADPVNLAAAYDPLRRQDPGIEFRAFSAHPWPKPAPKSTPPPLKKNQQSAEKQQKRINRRSVLLVL